jgi:hypothetical protein
LCELLNLSKLAIFLGFDERRELANHQKLISFWALD